MRESDFDSAHGGPGAGNAGGIGTDLVDCLLDSALEPLLDAAAAARNPERALLKVTVCDPACGDGRILDAAARRIARRVAAARSGSGRDGTPAPPADAVTRALRDVTEHCVYGVDRSGTAVEAARDRLRRAAGDPAAGTLDRHVKRGDSLIGTLPGVTEDGIPDAAFAPADGDDPKFARSLRRANVKPAPGQRTLFSDARPGQAARLERLAADAWCAAFVWAKRPDAPPPIVDQSFRDLRERGPSGILPETLKEIGRLAEEHRFFHWHLEFPEIARRGGFTCVVTAPPRDTAGRHDGRALFGFARGSGAYPACEDGLAEPGVTALRTDELFTERATALLSATGRAGLIVAESLVTGAGGRHLFGALTRDRTLAALYGFEDRTCALTFTGDAAPTGAARYAFGLRGPGELREDPDRAYPLAAEEITLVNPNTGAPPAFRSRRDAALVTEVYRHVPVLVDETRPDGDPWKTRLAPPFFRIRADADLFRSDTEAEADADARTEAGSGTGSEARAEADAGAEAGSGEIPLPVYEAAMVRPFDPYHAGPRYRLDDPEPVTERLRDLGWRWGWLCGWRGPVPPGDERAVVAAFVPRTAVAESFPLMMPRSAPPLIAGLIAAQSSLIFDFTARQKLGGGTRLRPETWKQLPVPAPATLEPHLSFLVPRVLELVYTDEALAPLAQDLDDDGKPFAWDSGRRAELSAELDAFFFRRYGVAGRDDVAYILGAYPSEPAALVLDAFDRMADSDAGGVPYETRIVPVPGLGPRVPGPEPE